MLTWPNENIGNNMLPLAVPLIMYLNWIPEGLCRLPALLDVEAKFHLYVVSWWAGSVLRNECMYSYFPSRLFSP